MIKTLCMDMENDCYTYGHRQSNRLRNPSKVWCLGSIPRNLGMFQLVREGRENARAERKPGNILRESLSPAAPGVHLLGAAAELTAPHPSD